MSPICHSSLVYKQNQIERVSEKKFIFIIQRAFSLHFCIPDRPGGLFPSHRYSVLSHLARFMGAPFSHFSRRNIVPHNSLFHNEHLCMGLGYLSPNADTSPIFFGNKKSEREREAKAPIELASCELVSPFDRFLPFSLSRPLFPSAKRPRWWREIGKWDVCICTVGLRLRSFGSRRARDNCGRMGKTLLLSVPSEVLR